MMKKILLALALITLLLAAAGDKPARLSRLTIINKSGLAVGISLEGQYTGVQYYLHVLEGSRSAPLEKIFTITPDIYRMEVDYIELWDPVYGYSCSSSPGLTVEATRNVRVVVLECDRAIPNRGEPPSMLKAGGFGMKRGR
jgi:hypothetical protein